MKKILFPVDHSKISKSAFVYALSLANTYQTSLTIFHLNGSISVECIEQMNQIVASHEEDVNLEHLVKDSQNRTIEETIKNQHIDAVVLPSKKSDNANEVLVGVLLSEVIANAKSLVFIIPENYTPHQTTNITFTTRFRDKDKKALDKCLSIAKTMGATVNCLHINNGTEDNTAKMEQWKELYKDENINFHIIKSSDPQNAILNYIQENQADLLAILTYKRSFFEEIFRKSTAQKISYYTSVPTLVIHETDVI
ncbi:MAG: universal stress protein [Bacteroidota bacterium]|nr:universal stress protein [Bacteroidota bacterium]